MSAGLTHRSCYADESDFGFELIMKDQISSND